MRSVLAFLLLLIAVPAAHAQVAPATLAAPAAPAVVHTVQVPSASVETSAAAEAGTVSERSASAEEIRRSDARQERNRSYWFVLGALVAVAVVLVFTL
jgi:predicted nucleic acid-binding Zn ribbon protein